MVRVSTDPHEIYAVIEKKLGGGRLLVKCIDDIPRQCKIRGKFNKKKEPMDVGTWILVGLYDFDKTNTKCDLLEVYTTNDVRALQKMDGQWHILGAEKQTHDLDMEESTASIELPMTINIDEI